MLKPRIRASPARSAPLKCGTSSADSGRTHLAMTGALPCEQSHAARGSTIMTRTFSLRAMRPVALTMASLTFAACEATKSSNPLSPSVAGPIGGVSITAPKPLEPAQGVKFKEAEQPIRLMIENSSTTGQRPITYTFEVSADTSFATKLFARSAVPPGDGRTSVQVDRLDLGKAYYWRVRAEDGANTSTYSTSQFEVLPKAQLGTPGGM